MRSDFQENELLRLEWVPQDRLYRIILAKLAKNRYFCYSAVMNFRFRKGRVQNRGGINAPSFSIGQSFSGRA